MSKKKKKDPNSPPVLTGNEAHVARLRAGDSIVFGGKGNSMVPKIKSGQKCRYAPVATHEDVKVGDMVFCHVGRWHFTHLLTAIKTLRDGTYHYQISNNHGHVNGWIPIERIFGKVVEVLPMGG